MTPEEGYELARHHRPGFKVIMGPCEARCESISTLSEYKLHRLPGHISWQHYDLFQLLGFIPSSWAQLFAKLAGQINHHVTLQEWVWLHGPATLDDAFNWLAHLVTSDLNQGDPREVLLLPAHPTRSLVPTGIS